VEDNYDYADPTDPPNRQDLLHRDPATDIRQSAEFYAYCEAQFWGLATNELERDVGG